MTRPVDLLALYLHLARAAEQRRRPHARDRLLVLAGTIGARMQLAPLAAYCRWKVLQHNPHHLIARWPTLTEALAQEEFLLLLRQLQRRYPPEKAEGMLQTLGIDRAHARDAYYSDGEYAAAIVGQSWTELCERFGEGAE